MSTVVESDSEANGEPTFIFMLMPFEKNLTDIYEQYIKAPLISKGYNVKRADDFYRSTDIIADILECINDADIIIADLTGRNPNVFYELGIAHRKKIRNVILICQKEDDIPFDLRGKRMILYENTLKGYEELREELPKYIKDIEEGVSEEENLISLTELDDREIINAIKTMKLQEISDLIVKTEFNRLIRLIKMTLGELLLHAEKPIKEKDILSYHNNLSIFISKSVLLRFDNDEKTKLFKFLFDNLHIISSFYHRSVIYDEFKKYTKDRSIINYIKENELIDFFINSFIESKSYSSSEFWIEILLNLKEIINFDKMKILARGATDNNQIYEAGRIPYKIKDLLSPHYKSFPSYIKERLQRRFSF